MKQASCIVTKDRGPRPAGKPDECFYCRQPLGAEHATTCVMRDRTVIVRVTIEMIREVPESWTPENIEFHMNESSWCAGNIVADLVELRQRSNDICLCPHFSAEYVREATEEDEEHWGIKAGSRER